MTTPRKKKTSTEVAPVAEAALVSVDTESIEIPTDPSLLYPPVPASQSVFFGHFESVIPQDKEPLWKKRLRYVPPAVGALIVIIALIAITL